MRPNVKSMLVVLVLLGGSGLACGEDPGDLALKGEIAKLERDTKALREVVADAQKGTFFRPDDILVGVHENAVLALLDAVLPVEKHIPGKTPAVIRIERATVRFDGGLGTVTVVGRAWLERWPSVAAEVQLSGGFAGAHVDLDQGLLITTLALDTLEVKPANAGVAAVVFRGRLLRELNARAREAVEQALPPLEVPLKLDQTIDIPDLKTGPLQTRGGSLQVTATVTRIIAMKRRLWIELQPKLGEWKRRRAPQ